MRYSFRVDGGRKSTLTVPSLIETCNTFTIIPRRIRKNVFSRLLNKHALIVMYRPSIHEIKFFLTIRAQLKVLFVSHI